MKLNSILQALVPYYGAGARLRFYLRLREFYRKHNMMFLAQCLKSHMQYKYGCEISVNACISPAIDFMHTVGVVVGDGVVIKPGVTIYSGVVIGRKDIHSPEYPTIQEGALLCTGCTILGNVIIGSKAVIGANSLVLSDCEPGGVYVGSPAIRIK